MELNSNVPESYLPRNYNRINVMNDTNGSKGICKYVNDEIYNSRACFNKDFNPQNAYWSDGKYYFDFPTIWYNANSVNKAIGLRSINIYPKAFTLSYQVTFTCSSMDLDGEIRRKSLIRKYYYIVRPQDSTEEIFSGMCSLMKESLRNSDFDYVLDIKYKIGEYNCYSFQLINDDGLEAPDLEIKPLETDFITFLGEPLKLHTHPDEDNPNITNQCVLMYMNIWNRRDLYIHASFVNYTSFNYLGKDGEFYTKISKIYDFAYAPQKFYFEISFDGMRPVKFNQVDFMVGLCFIVDEHKYNGV